MAGTIIAALITGGLALVGVIITNLMSNNKMQRDFEKKMEVVQATTNIKIEELTREVREHNNFAKRMPVVENEIKHLNGEVEHIEKDISKLQGYHSEKRGVEYD